MAKDKSNSESDPHRRLRRPNGDDAPAPTTATPPSSPQLACPPAPAPIPRFEESSEDLFDQLWVRVQRRLAGSAAAAADVTTEEYEIRRQSIQSIVVTSWTTGEGSSTVALGLAARAAAASQGAVCLVDADSSRQGAITGALPADSLGLNDLLEGNAAFDDAIVPARGSKLHYLPAGQAAQREHTSSDARMQEIIATLEERFRYVFYDTASLKGSVEGYRWGRFIENTILVVRAGSARRQTVTHAVTSMRLQGMRVLGLVLNRRLDALPAWLYRYL